MPIYNYLCDDCGREFEAIGGYDDKTFDCVCGGHAHRVIAASGAYLGNQDAAWLKTVVEVVDKSGGQHCQEFIKNPSRDNYRRWMKGEGIQPLEPGEKGGSQRTDRDRAEEHRGRVRECKEKYRRRNSIQVRG